ncbi:pyridoxine 5'-phosphate oxidase C-terminal domain-containing protein [Tunturiibacter empetritectus]
MLWPEKIEFWKDGEGRLHDRFLFTRSGGVCGGVWNKERLFP